MYQKGDDCSNGGDNASEVDVHVLQEIDQPQLFFLTFPQVYKRETKLHVWIKNHRDGIFPQREYVSVGDAECGFSDLTISGSYNFPSFMLNVRTICQVCFLCLHFKWFFRPLNINWHHAAAYSHTCNLLLKRIFPGIHLDEFDAVEYLIHRAHAVICYQYCFPSEFVNELS